LQWQDVHFGKDPHLRVIGKGRKKGIVPLLLKTAWMLKRMKKDIGPVFVQVASSSSGFISNWILLPIIPQRLILVNF
jgi:hypothetical protein